MRLVCYDDAPFSRVPAARLDKKNRPLALSQWPPSPQPAKTAPSQQGAHGLARVRGTLAPASEDRTFTPPRAIGRVLRVIEVLGDQARRGKVCFLPIGVVGDLKELPFAANSGRAEADIQRGRSSLSCFCAAGGRSRSDAPVGVALRRGFRPPAMREALVSARSEYRIAMGLFHDKSPCQQREISYAMGSLKWTKVCTL